MAGNVYEIGFKIAGVLSGDFSKSFKTANKAVQNFSDSLNLLNKKAADVSAIIKMRKEIENNDRVYEESKQRVAELGRQISATTNPSKELIAEFNKQKNALVKTNAAIERQKESLKQLESQTGLAGADIKILIAKEKELARAAERVAAAQNSQSKATQAMSKNSQTISSTAGYASGVGATMGAGLMASFNIGAEFEKDMARVAAVSRATDEDLAKMTKTARDLGATTVWSASDAAQGMQYLAMAGFKTNDIMETMPGMLQLASAGAIDLASASDVASNILTGFGLSASDMARVGDVLTNTFTQSNTTLEGLGHTMKYAAPVAKSMGVSIEEAAAMAGKLGDAGIQGEMAGTTLRSVMLRLSAPSKSGAEAMDELGVSTTDAAGNMKPYPQILAELNKAMDGMSESAKSNFTKTIFETEAMSGALVLMEQAGSGSLDKFVQGISKSGAAADVSRKQTNNLKGDISELSSATEEMALKIYDSVAPALREMAQTATIVITSLGTWAQENPDLVKKITIVAGAIAGITSAALPMLAILKTTQFAFALLKAPILAVRSAIAAARVGMLLYNGTLAAGTAVTKGARVAMIAYSAAAKVAAVGQKILNAAMIANPIGLVITAILALIAVGVALYKNWETIGPILGSIFSAIWATTKNIFGNMLTFIKNVISNILSNFKNLISFVVNIFTGDWGAAWENVKNIFGNIFSTLVEVIKFPLNNVIALVNLAIKGINGAVGKVKVPDWVPGLGGKSFKMNIPEIPQLADGGIATRSTLANIGEGGEPEAVLPLSKLSSMLGGQGNGGSINVSFTPTINVNGTSADVYGDVKRGLDAGITDLEKAIERVLAKQKRVSFA